MGEAGFFCWRGAHFFIILINRTRTQDHAATIRSLQRQVAELERQLAAQNVELELARLRQVDADAVVRCLNINNFIIVNSNRPGRLTC